MSTALRKRRLGLGKVLGTENLSDLMTKHVDSKLLGQHVTCMGCQFLEGRAELAPQVVQEVHDAVDYVEDLPSGLMTASASQESTITETHFALDSELCLPSFFCLNVRRLDGDNCRGGDEARERSLNRRWDDSCVDRDCTLAGEHLRGHPQFCFRLPFGQSRSRGGVCFSTILSHRLSVHVNERLHLCTRDVQQFTIFP